jgi:hypothetical protein
MREEESYIRRVDAWTYHVGGTLLWALAAAGVADAGIPLEVINNFPVIGVVIGDETIPVAFDLGGDNTIELTAAALEKINVRYLQERYTWLDAKGHKLEARMFVIPELRIGDAVFRNVEGHEDAEAPDWRKVRAGQGRLGRALFAPSHKLELDYQGRTMRLDSACAGHRVPFDPKWNGEPVAKAKTDIGELTFVWDTGAPMSLIQAATANGRAVTKAFVLGDRDFGPLTFRAVTFVQPEGADGFIGYDFFARHKVCVDFPGQAFWIE